MNDIAKHNNPEFEIDQPPSYVPSNQAPNVQEMVKKNPLEVPERYIRSPQEIEKDKYMSHLSSEIPVIDLALLSSGNSDELLKLDMACKDWGFFQVVNHGAPKVVLERMKDKTAEFLNLPIEEKNKYAMPSDDIQGYGHPNKVSEDQPLIWSDSLMLVQYPTRYRKPQLWPKTPQGFMETMEAYSSEINRVGVEILGSLSVTMGMEKHVLLGLHKEIVQGLRVNYYPPCSIPEQVMGMTRHRDSTSITLLMQSDDVCGLEIQHKGGWVPVVPDVLVAFVGDAIEIWSNGKYKSAEHRAMANKNKGRTSFVSFFFPRDDVEVEPLDSMIDAQNPKLYKKIIYGEYMRQSLKRKLDGKTQNIDEVRIN